VGKGVSRTEIASAKMGEKEAKHLFHHKEKKIIPT